jgi:5-methylcytosine-specific restriction endonuclease McrA
MRQLARGSCVSPGAARPAVRRLVARGMVFVVKRSRAGHVAEIRTPEEVIRVQGDRVRSRFSPGTDLEELNFLNHPARRKAIHEREGGRCFYCLGKVTAQTRSLDHVVPRVELVDNTYRNLVSCCKDCNHHKNELPAIDYLCRLHRDKRLTAAELTGRMRAVDALSTGKLRPRFGARRGKRR